MALMRKRYQKWLEERGTLPKQEDEPEENPYGLKEAEDSTGEPHTDDDLEEEHGDMEYMFEGGEVPHPREEDPEIEHSRFSRGPARGLPGPRAGIEHPEPRAGKQRSAFARALRMRRF
jgi:hypothetical protein